MRILVRLGRLGLLVAFGLLCGCGGGNGGADGQGDDFGTGVGTNLYLHAYRKVRSYTVAQANAAIASLSASAGAQMPAATTGIDCYAITYKTGDSSRASFTATGMVAVPQVVVGALPLLSFQHGTQVERTECPSNPNNDEMQAAVVAFASGRYFVVAADYFGLGNSPGYPLYHRYMQTDMTVRACIDAMRAARELAQELRITLSPQTYLAGYSQGGHATMALHRAIQETYPQEFSVTASAPMSGPYDLSGVQMTRTLSLDQPGSPVFLAYVLVSYHRRWGGIYTAPADAFQSPYDQRVEGLYDGTHSYAEVAAGLPATPRELLTAAFIEAVTTNPDHPLNQRLRENDCYDWKPNAPVRLYHGRADTVVYYANAEKALAAMQARGADVTLVNVGDTRNHVDSFAPSLVAARNWFDSLAP